LFRKFRTSGLRIQKPDGDEDRAQSGLEFSKDQRDLSEAKRGARMKKMGVKMGFGYSASIGIRYNRDLIVLILLTLAFGTSSGQIAARYGNRGDAPRDIQSEWGQRRPLTSHTRRCDAMRCDAMRARGISSICRDRFGMNLDRTMTSAGRSPSYRRRCSFAMRSRSSIITAHAKMQFKLQVHVISRSRETISACRPAGGHSVSNDPIKRIRNASAPPRLGNARSTHRYIHPDFCHYANKHGNSRVAAKRRTRHHASAMRSRKKEKLAKFA